MSHRNAIGSNATGSNATDHSNMHGNNSNGGSNPPPKTVPYVDYKYPNYEALSKTRQFDQPESGFGFSNNRISSDENAPDRIHLPKHQHYDRSQIYNPESLQPFSRSEQFLFRDKYGDYNLMEQVDAPNGYVYREMIEKTISNNPLTELFFSERNVNHVMRLACRLIRLFCDQYKISPQSQSKAELLTVFRSVYLQTPTDPYGDLEKELCTLNRAVLDWMVPRMIVNIQQYLGYVRDQSTRRMTIPRAQHTGMVGTKTNKFFSSMLI